MCVVVTSWFIQKSRDPRALFRECGALSDGNGARNAQRRQFADNQVVNAPRRPPPARAKLPRDSRVGKLSCRLFATRARKTDSHVRSLALARRSHLRRGMHVKTVEPRARCFSPRNWENSPRLFTFVLSLPHLSRGLLALLIPMGVRDATNAAQLRRERA